MKLIQILLILSAVVFSGCASSSGHRAARAGSAFMTGFANGYNSSRQNQPAPSRPINCTTSGGSGLYTTNCY